MPGDSERRAARGPERELLLLRHAKSSWKPVAVSDHARPLAKRGRRDAPRIAQWMRAQGLAPGWVVSSPALRARQTADAVVAALGSMQEDLRFDERIYLADDRQLLQVLAECPPVARVLLVGHNPGLDQLLQYLCGTGLPRTDKGKLLTTAALARLAMPPDWHGLQPHCARLLALIRPRELESG
jgi:phosphohistidine phosphatase